MMQRLLQLKLLLLLILLLLCIKQSNTSTNTTITNYTTTFTISMMIMLFIRVVEFIPDLQLAFIRSIVLQRQWVVSSVIVIAIFN